MADFWEGVKRMLGVITSPRHQPPPIGQAGHDEAATQKRLAELSEREDARRRIAALDVRVDVLTRRMKRHEGKPH